MSNHSNSSNSGSVSSSVDQGSTALTALLNILALYAVAMSVRDRMRTARMRRGGLEVAAMLAQIAQSFGIVVPRIDTADLVARAGIATKLVKQTNDAHQAWQTLSDTSLRYGSQVWVDSLALYDVLKGAAKRDPDLRAALAKVKAFMKPRRAPKAAEPAPAPVVKAA